MLPRIYGTAQFPKRNQEKMARECNFIKGEKTRQSSNITGSAEVEG
jgi:hypothetical protein